MKPTIAQFLNIKKFPFEIHDSNGKLIYRENSDGLWFKIEFDSNGNIIYYKSSSGYWFKQEFDSNGSLIYLESSLGTKEYFDPKPSCENKVVEIEGVKYKLSKL